MALDIDAYEPPDFYEFEVSPGTDWPPTAPSNASPIISPTLSPVERFGQNWPPRDDPQTPIEHLKTALVAAAVLSLIFLIAKDAHKAFTRRAHWIPCDFLVLSAFSIQMLLMLNTQNQEMATSAQTNQTMAAFSETARWALTSMKEATAGNVASQGARWKDFLMIHNSRTILCVFTAYVMPSMADRGLEYAWVRWVALVITVFHHVTSQFYSIVKGKPSSETPDLLRIWPEPHGRRNAHYYVFATIISLCFILLILLLASATVAGRSIERIVAQQIPLVLRGRGELFVRPAEKTEGLHQHHYSCFLNVKFDVNTANQHYHLHRIHNESCPQTAKGAAEIHHESCGETSEEGAARGEEERCRRHCHYCWERVEAAVLKAWIIVRAYSVQPVLARSALSASAAVIVTIQIVITIVGGLSKVLRKNNKGEKNTFKLVALVVQSIFILIAWALVNLRWATAVAYHRRHDSDTWRSGLKIEDFWTRHLKELQQGEESKLEEAESLDKEVDELVSAKNATVPISLLLSLAIGLQSLLVSLSKAFWCVSLMIFHNKWMLKLFNFLFERHILCVFEDYPKYEKILKEVQMLGESPESLWVSNRKSIEEAKRLTIQGNHCNCDDLVEFLITKRTAQPHTVLNFTSRKMSIQSKENSAVQKQQSPGPLNNPLLGEQPFSDDTTKSRKMIAVAFLGIIVQLSPFNGIDDKEQCSTSAEDNQEQRSISYVFPPEDVKKCLKVYTQAWEIIDFVDEAEGETEADRISSEAADKYFKALQERMPKEEEDSSKMKLKPATQEWVREALNKLKTETSELKHLNPHKKVGKKNPQSICQLAKKRVCEAWHMLKKAASKLKDIILRKKGGKKGPQIRCEGNDSINWKAVASGSAVYNLCNSIEYKDGTDVSELRKELESSLAYIIRECLDKTQNLLLLKSRKWALHRDEKRLAKALYAAGKAKLIMEKLVSDKLAIVSHN